MMMTNTTTEQVPHGSLFATQPGAPTTYQALNRDPVWHELAVQIDEYVDMQRALVGLRAWGGAGTWDQRADVWQSGLDEAVRTGDLDAAFAPVLESLKTQAFAESASNFQQTAIGRLADRAEAWVAVEDTQKQFAVLLNAEIDRLLQESRATAGLVAGARSFDDIGADAPRARAFADLQIAAERLAALLSTGAAVLAPQLYASYADPDREDPRRWPMSWLFKSYTHAWPTYWRRREIVVPMHGASNDQILGAVAPPWEGMKPLAFMQWVTERDVELVAASRSVTAKRSKDLDESAHKRRLEEIEKRTDKDWIEGRVTEYHV